MELYGSISHVFFDVTISKADIRNLSVGAFDPNILFKHLITIFGAVDLNA